MMYNVPAYAEALRYWVAREVDGELWFYGAWDTFNRAAEAADEVDGVVRVNPAMEG